VASGQGRTGRTVYAGNARYGARGYRAMSKSPKPKQPPEPTDAQKLKRANDAVRMTQLIKNGDREMLSSPMFRARMRKIAKGT
jgi:hypothetical protein